MFQRHCHRKETLSFAIFMILKKHHLNTIYINTIYIIKSLKQWMQKTGMRKKEYKKAKICTYVYICIYV